MTEASPARLPASERIEWLDGWRTIAVVTVIVSHWERFYTERPIIDGKFGVYLFFGISGFIVTKLLLREHMAAGAIDFRAFYVRRTLRILPPLLIYITACLLIFEDQAVLGGALRSMLFSCNIEIPLGNCGWLFGHTWSLAFEEQFYLLLPAAIVAITARRAGALMMLALAVSAIPFFLPLDFVGKIGFLQIYMLLVLGTVTAWHERRALPVLSKIPPMASLIMLLASALWMRMEPGMVQQFLGLLVPPAMFAAMMALPLSSPLARQFLGSMPMNSIGLYSYSLYLWQQLALIDEPWNRGWVPAFLLAVALGLSALSFHFVETPARRLAKRSR